MPILKGEGRGGGGERVEEREVEIKEGRVGEEEEEVEEEIEGLT